MKKIYLWITIVFMGALLGEASAQCVHNVSTHPLYPVNDQFDPIFPGKTNVFLNSFDWGGMDGIFDEVPLNGSVGWENITIPGENYLLNNLFDDANAVTGSNYDMLLQPYGAGADERDFHWEDGWELLYLNTGYYPNGAPIDEANGENIIPNAHQVDNGYVPYIMLYNRYTGKVRLFYKVFTELGQLDDVRSLFRFKQNDTNTLPVSGLFRCNKPYDIPLSLPSDNFGISSTTKIPNNTQAWFYNEFTVSYDPCTCNYPSRLVLDLYGVKSTDMVLHGRGVEVEQNLANPDGSVAYPADYLTNFSGEDGYVIYGMMDSLISSYQSELAHYNTALADYQAQQNNIGFQVLTQLQEYIDNGFAGFGFPGLANWAAGITGDIFGPAGFTNDSLSGDSTKINAAIKQASKGILGKGFSTLNMSIYGKKLNRPVKPSMPTANYSEMYYEGVISDTIPILGSPVYTPGTYTEAYSGLPLLNPGVYPAYNEILGQFALLNKPKIDVTEYEEEFNSMCQDNGCLLHGGWHLNYNKRILKLRLTDSLRFKFNHALDFDTTRTQLYGSFVITLTGDADISNDSLIDRQYNDKSEMYLAHHFVQNSKRTLIVETPWLKVEKLLNRIFSMTIENSNGCICGAYPDPPFPPNVHPVQPAHIAESIDRIEFKLMADMYFNQVNFHGDQNNTTQVFTYLLFDRDGSPQNLNTTTFLHEDGSSWQRPYRPGTLLITNPINISPSSPFVTNQIGDTLFINAERIQLNNHITVSPGYIAVFQGVDSVNVGTNGHLSPNIILRINDFGQSHVTEVTQDYLDDYCTGAISPSYQANIASKDMKRRLQNLPAHTWQKSGVVFPERNDITIHPNPATDRIWITSTTKPISEIRIFDLSGRGLIQQKTDGTDLSRVAVNVASLQSGVYIVQVVCGDEHSTQKLIIGR